MGRCICFMRKCQVCFFQAVEPLCTFTKTHVRIPICSAALPTFSVVSLFNFSCIGRCEMVYCHDFKLQFLVVNEFVQSSFQSVRVF